MKGKTETHELIGYIIICALFNIMFIAGVSSEWLILAMMQILGLVYLLVNIEA